MLVARPLRDQRELLELGCQAEAVCQPEREHRRARVRRDAEGPETAHVLECLVDDRQPDDGVDEMGAGMNAAERAAEQRETVPDGEQADVEQDVLEAVEEEDHADEEQQVIVARHHVLGAEIHEGKRIGSARGGDEGCIRAADGVGKRRRRDQRESKRREGVM